MQRLLFWELILSMRALSSARTVYLGLYFIIKRRKDRADWEPPLSARRTTNNTLPLPLLRPRHHAPVQIFNYLNYLNSFIILLDHSR